MAKSKKDLLAGALNTAPKKKPMPNVEEVEAITKKVYEKKIEIEKTLEEKTQRTTLDLPKSLHLKAKVHAMEVGMTLKKYIKRLIETDLQSKGKI